MGDARILLENIEFKKWIQIQVRKNIVPTLVDKGFKKGRVNCFVREREGVVQFLQFEIKQSKAKIHGGTSPIYFPLQSLPYYGFRFSSTEQRLWTTGVSVSPSAKGNPTITSDAISQWAAIEHLIKNVVLAQLEEITSLNKLMEVASYNVPNNDNWNGVKWYALGVYECLMNNFQKGAELLRAARDCKKGYVDFLHDVGCSFDVKKDQVAAIFSFVDMLCSVMPSDTFDSNAFKEMYEKICLQSRQWYFDVSRLLYLSRRRLHPPPGFYRKEKFP